MKKQLCCYCNKKQAGNTEHVFPNGLGAENVRMNCVCEDCNNYFSRLERELYQKSFLSIFRLNNELSGYNKLSELSFYEMLSFDEKNKIALEVGYTKGLSPYIKAQVFEKENKFWTDGEKPDMELLKKVLGNWIQKSSKVIYFEERERKYVLFKITSKHISFQLAPEIEKANNCIEIRIISKEYKHYEDFTTRIFLDKKKSKKLVIRAKSNNIGMNYLNTLLKTIVNQPTLLESYPNRKIKTGTLKTSFNHRFASKAIVKIGLNCLMHYYPSNTSHPGLKDAKKFVLNDNDKFNIIAPKKIDGLDDNLSNVHYVQLYQFEERLDFRIGLFSSAHIYGFTIPGIKIMTTGNISNLLINYTEKQNTFQYNYGVIKFD